MKITKQHTATQQAAMTRVILSLSASLFAAMMVPVQAAEAESHSAKAPVSHAVSSVAAIPLAKVPRGILLSVGQASQSAGDLGQKLQTLGYGDLSVSDDKKAVAWSLGYRHPISDRFSADIQYLQQGKTEPKVEASLPSGKTSAEASKDTAEAMPKRGQGISAIALYHHPIGNKLKFQGGFGAVAWQSKRTATVGTSTYTSKSDGVSAIVQLGFSYPVTRNTRLEAHWQHTFMPFEAVDRLGLGLAVGF